MVKPDCLACERLRLECIWPEVKRIVQEPSAVQTTTSTSTSTANPLPSNPPQQYMQPDHLDSELFNHLPERSAVDGLLDLIADNGYADMQLPLDPASISPSIPSVPTYPIQTPITSNTDVYDFNTFTFDEVSILSYCLTILIVGDVAALGS